MLAWPGSDSIIDSTADVRAGSLTCCSCHQLQRNQIQKAQRRELNSTKRRIYFRDSNSYSSRKSPDFFRVVASTLFRKRLSPNSAFRFPGNKVRATRELCPQSFTSHHSHLTSGLRHVADANVPSSCNARRGPFVLPSVQAYFITDREARAIFFSALLQKKMF